MMSSLRTGYNGTEEVLAVLRTTILTNNVVINNNNCTNEEMVVATSLNLQQEAPA